jgi:N-carbamoyl-L-amino-acid hydrolase
MGVGVSSSFETLWAELEPVGRDERTGGYRRFAYEPAELACREWFVGAAQARGLDVETDRNGNLWGWWGRPGDDALVLGSHLDSVDSGGAYDGPLGVVSALAAVEALAARGVAPTRPVAVVAFADEEGGRFGVPCSGSRLLTGALDPDRARGLRDADGTTMADAMHAAGHDPGHLGRDGERLARIGAFVELHIEQGRETAVGHAEAATLDQPVAVAAGIWPHGRYRLTFTGEPNHAGATPMELRRDPMTTFARTALTAATTARLLAARATFGRLEVEPNVTNAIPAEVRAWLDARAADDETLQALLQTVLTEAEAHARADSVSLCVSTESTTRPVHFDDALRRQVAAALAAAGGTPPPTLPTAAGHDAGVLAEAGVPTAMLFVRNPTGVSHSPAEHAEAADCLAGVDALTTVVEALACGGTP